MSVQLNFNARQVEPQQAFQPLEDGWYRMSVRASEWKPTSNNAETGNAYAQLDIGVDGGKFANRKVFARLNLKNTSQEAVDIAYAELSAICHATGVLDLTDTAQLHGISMLVKVKKTPKTEKYDEGNEIKGYKHINEINSLGVPLMGEGGEAQTQQAPGGFGQMQQPAQQAPVQQPVQQQPAQQAAPWGNNQQQAPVEQPAQQPAQQQVQQQQPQQQPVQQQQFDPNSQPQQPWNQQPPAEQPVQQQQVQQQAPVEQQQVQQQPQQQPVQQAGTVTPPWGK